MRVAVQSCWAYRDAWLPFFKLFQKFWQEPCDLWLITDRYEQAAIDEIGVPFSIFEAGNQATWSECLSGFAKTSKEPFVLFLEDFFPTAPVNIPMVQHALKLMSEHRAGCVRLYPCPGANEDFGDPFFGRVSHGADYRISTMTALWDPVFIGTVASYTDTAWDFELHGTKLSREMKPPVLAWKRGVTPWPVEYICTGITRRRWTSGAKALFEREGIKVDYTLRPSE